MINLLIYFGVKKLVLTESYNEPQAKFFPTTQTILIGDAKKKLKSIPDESVHLMVTSPPYGQIKNYSRSGQIGFGQEIDAYHNDLNKVWREVSRVLHPGCRMVINIGDEFIRSSKSQIYQIVPHHAYIISNVLASCPDLVYTGTINWSKVTKTKTNGGGKIMGSVFTPRDGHFFVNREYIIVFKKKGKGPKNSKEIKERSRFTIEERREMFQDTWKIPGINQTGHIAMFPNEVPERLIRMYSFVGDTVLDPFLGSGTTLSMAAKWERNGIGIELGYTSDDSWKEFTETKIRENMDIEDEIMFIES